MTAPHLLGLRNFLETLDERELERITTPVALSDVGAILDGNPRAVLFEDVEGCSLQLAGNVMGGRERLASSIGATGDSLVDELSRRLAVRIAPVIVTEAPCQDVVLEGDDADLLELPVHLQHELDGAPYISAAIDFALNPHGGSTNVGVRRLMLRGPRLTGIDLNAPSDLRAIYVAASERGEPLPVAFVVGSHPADYLAATPAASGDELAVMGGVRGHAVPIVRCVSQSLYVPADAEVVLEGVIDPGGYSDTEGPYGEYLGYYGVVKHNPLFRLTAITRRRDAIFQTATIGGAHLHLTDTSQLVAAATEAMIVESLRGAVRAVRAVRATPSSGGMNVRIALDARYSGEARNAIAAVFASPADVKHVFVVDSDVDIDSDTQLDWALATRFQGDRDLVVASGFRATPLDPSLGGEWIGAKVGFDLTRGALPSEHFAIPEPPSLDAGLGAASVEELLAAGNQTFADLLRGTGSRDGREIVRRLAELEQSGRLVRNPDGSFAALSSSEG